jgi:two-component system, NtrC family, sensor kinase
VSTASADQVRGRTVEELERELSEAHRREAATAEVLGVINSSPGELEPVFQAMLQSAVRICDANVGNLALFDGRELRMAAFHGAPKAFEELRRRNPTIPIATSGLGRVVETKQVIHVADLAAEDRYASSALVKLAGARTFVGVPMLKENELIGAIAIYRQEVCPFSDKQIELVKSFASQAVIAIENTRLFEAEQARTRELKESLEYQIATSEILNVISRSPNDAQPLFDTIARTAARLCKAEFCHVCRFDGTLIYSAAENGLSPEGSKALRRAYPMAPGRGTATTRSILSCGVEEIPDVHADLDYTQSTDATIMKLRSVVAVPMLKDGRPIGTIAVARSPTGRFPSRQRP